MKIIFDTNIIHEDFFLSHANFVAMCITAAKCGIDILMPKIVVDEFINQYREKLEEVDTEVNKAVRLIEQIDKIRMFQSIFPASEKDKLIRQYPETLSKRMEELEIKVLPYPNVSHEIIVARDLHRRRPFQRNGKGYRDALIWESILSVLKPALIESSEPQVIFINKNTSDFCDGNELHPHLKSDLKDKSVPVEDVKIFTNIADVVKQFIKPRQEQLENLKNHLSSSALIGNISIEKHLTDLMDRQLDLFLNDYGSGYGGYDYHGPVLGILESPELKDLTDVRYEITDVRRLSDTRIIMDISVEANAYVEGFIYKPDRYLYDDAEIYSIIVEDWNNYYSLVEECIPVFAHAEFIIDQDMTNILMDSLELDYEKILEKSRF